MAKPETPMSGSMTKPEKQVMRLVTASVDRLGAAAEAALRFDRAALAVLRLVAACGHAAGGSHAVHAEAAAFLELHAQGLLRVLHNAGSGVHRWARLSEWGVIWEWVDVAACGVRWHVLGGVSPGKHLDVRPLGELCVLSVWSCCGASSGPAWTLWGRLKTVQAWRDCYLGSTFIASGPGLVWPVAAQGLVVGFKSQGSGSAHASAI